jgi:ribosomal protein L7/L12
MANLEKIVEELSALTVLEAAELAKMLEDKWGVSAAAAVMALSNGSWASGRASPSGPTMSRSINGWRCSASEVNHGSDIDPGN